MYAEISIKIPREDAVSFSSTEDATEWLMRYNQPPKNQKKFIKEHLLLNGSVSRNFALARYISRLGAIISVLKEEGLDINGEYGQDGINYIYTLINDGAVDEF